MKFTKNLLLLPIIVLFAIAMSNIEVKAVDLLCKPDCEEDEFCTRGYLTDIVVGDCIYSVSFQIRKACDEWCDIGITHFYKRGDCPEMSARDMLNMLSEKVIKIVIENGIFQGCNLEDCDPENGDCSEYWRITKAQCWILAEVNPYGWRFYEPCDDECCLTYYEVCRDINGEITVTTLQSYGTGRCPSTPCEQVCP